MAQLAQGLGLDLADPLAGNGKRPTNLLFADWRLQRPAVEGSACRIARNNWKWCSLAAPATSSFACAKTRSSGEPYTVPSPFPLRLEWRRLSRDSGYGMSNRNQCSGSELKGQSDNTESYTAWRCASPTWG
jgi:hypothetical protein